MFWQFSEVSYTTILLAYLGDRVSETIHTSGHTYIVLPEVILWAHIYT